jgi:GNAT superfamily N-acetyltransferase
MNISSGPVRDWESAVDLIQQSWRPGLEATVEYTPGFLSRLSECPSDQPVLAPAFYDDGVLFAFVIGFPRRVRLEGQVRKLLLMSFFTVAPAYRGQGYGRSIWVECLRQAKCVGYDGVIHYCVEGNPSNQITTAAAESAGFAARRVFTVKFLMGMLRPATDEPAEPSPAEVLVDTCCFLKASEGLNADVPLVRQWSEAEANWHLTSPGRLCYSDPAGGVVSGIVQRSADSAHTPCLSIEDVLWDRLTAEARRMLLDRLMRRASRIASVAVVPMLGYADLSPFLAAGFRRSPRLIHAYLTLWDTSADFRDFSGMYLDIL